MASTNAVLAALARTGGLFKEQLLEMLEIDEQSLAEHLKTLSAAGFVEYEDVGAGRRQVRLTGRGAEEVASLGLLPDEVPTLQCQVKMIGEGGLHRCPGRATGITPTVDEYRKETVGVFVCSGHEGVFDVEGMTLSQLEELARTNGFRLNVD